MDEHLQREICARIKEARIEAGMTQDEMADLLGMGMRGYQNYESIRVPFRRLDEIAKLTGTTQEWLLRGDDPAEASNPSQLEIAELRQDVRDLRASVEELLRQVVGARLAEPPSESASGA